MLTVKFTTAYKKSYKLMKKRGKDLSLLEEVIDTLRQGKVLDEKYRDHELRRIECIGSRRYWHSQTVFLAPDLQKFLLAETSCNAILDI